jgi:hypothetical protein
MEVRVIFVDGKPFSWGHHACVLERGVERLAAQFVIAYRVFLTIFDGLCTRQKRLFL